MMEQEEILLMMASMMYIDCASLINNVYGITGKDIQFNMYGRSSTTIMHNVSNEIQQNITDWKYIG